MNRIQFNTGRKYGPTGQTIVAKLSPSNLVTFMDHDRLIAGEFQLQDFEEFTAKTVLSYYDSNKYFMSCIAMSGHDMTKGNTL
jgi:hypothetical protein